MKDRKMIMAIGLALCVGMITAGCAGAVKNGPQTEAKEMNLTDEKQDAHSVENTGQEAGRKPDAEEEEKTEQDVDGKPDAGEPENEKADREEAKEPGAGADGEEIGGQKLNRAEGTESLGGKVQSPQEDGMILAQTTQSDENGMVTLLQVEDAKKIPVKFTADTKVERWKIQGGGAGIDMQEASFSDLEEGQGVEVEGNFEGETFVAARVIIEEYE